MRKWIEKHPKETKIIAAIVLGWIAITIIFNPLQALVYFLVLGVIPIVNIQMGFYVTLLFCAASSYLIWQWGKQVKEDLYDFVDYINLMESKQAVKSVKKAPAQEQPKIAFEDLTIHNL